MENILQNLSIIALPILLAITLHEAAHGIMAKWRGDNTAYKLGRVTLNPFKHMDLFGTIIMPVLLYLISAGSFLFGYAKPVPVNVQKLFVPRRDMILVALAGPLTNFILAVISAFLFRLMHYLPEVIQNWAEQMLIFSTLFNVFIALFNLLPLLPLDGGRIIWGLLPPAWGRIFAKSERWGLVVLLGIIFLLPMIGKQFNQDWNILHYILVEPAQNVAEKIFNTIVP